MNRAAAVLAKATASAVLGVSIAATACGSAGAGGGSGWMPVAGDVHSVPEFLAALPDRFRSRHALMFRSRSLQVASYDAPRAILYSEDAKAIVTFDGTSDTIEIMTFDESDSSFVFKEATFPLAGGRPSLALSEANPERCCACHGSPPRPIWDTYPLWPGAYGESDLVGPSADERRGFTAFSAARAEHPRYRYLPEPTETALEVAERQYHGEVALARNAELGELLGALNAKAIARELRVSPHFPMARYALVAALAPRCGGLTDALPEDARDSFRRDYGAFATESARADEEQDLRKRQRAQTPATGPARPPRGETAMTRLRYLAEHVLGVSTKGWTLALEKDTYDFTSSRQAATSFEQKLFSEIAAFDPRLTDLYWHAGDDRAFCEYVNRHSRSEWQAAESSK